MRFDIVTLFPQMITDHVAYGVLGRAVDNGLVQIGVWNPREYSDDKHGAVDDYLYGGGTGMLMQAPCVCAAVEAAKAAQPANSLAVYLSPQGQPINQDTINRAAQKYDGMVLLAGRYKGVDERVMASMDEEWSLGDYVLSGGEVPALAVIDAVARQIDGVVGARESIVGDSFMDGLLDAPHYTRPAEYQGRAVPDVLLGGDHEAIRRWRLKQALGRTLERRPDLLRKRKMSAEENDLLREYADERALEWPPRQED